MPITHRSIAESTDGSMRIEELEGGRARVTLRLDLDDKGIAEVDEATFIGTAIEYAEDRGLIPRRRNRSGKADPAEPEALANGDAKGQLAMPASGGTAPAK